MIRKISLFKYNCIISGLIGGPPLPVPGMHAAAIGALPGAIPGVAYPPMAFPGPPVLAPMIPRFR